MNKALVKKLDRSFSKYIRARDTKDGVGKCCSCGQIKLYAELDAGHFINRKHYSLRWREDNVHAQCIPCNRFDEGNSAGYALFMIDKYGKSHVEYLEGLKHSYAGYVDSELELLIQDYKTRLKEWVA